MNEVHIPTVGGQMNVVNIGVSGGVSLSYEAWLSQVGAGIPNALVIKDTITAVGGFGVTWTYIGQGEYGANVVANEFVLNTLLLASMGQITGVSAYTSFYRIDDNNLKLECRDILGALQDDNEVFVKIEQPINVSVDTDLFAYVLGQLDAVQKTLWQKIVLRYIDGFGLEAIVEVDGAKWRKTANFATSSVAIRS